MKIVSQTTDTISVRECHQSQHEITTPENSTMTSTVTPEKLPWSQNSSSNTSFRTELCSSEASAILEQWQPLNTTKTTILKPLKPSDNPKMKKIQRKKKTDTNERKITDMFQKQHQKPETTTTVQVSREQTTTKTCKTSEKIDLHITSASNGKIDRQDNNTEFTDLNFCDTTTTPGLPAKSESKLLLSIQLGSNSCDQKTQKGKRSKLMQLFLSPILQPENEWFRVLMMLPFWLSCCSLPAIVVLQPASDSGDPSLT